MIYLLTVSIIWAFSFGLIKESLTSLNPIVVSFIRLSLSSIVFLPLLRIKNINNTLKIKLMITGAVQYGLMYTLYIYSYQYLQSFEVVIFTVLTPIYVVMISNILTKKNHLKFFITASLAVGGTYIAVYHDFSDNNLIYGFLLLQVSNVCFAFGQVYYKHLLNDNKNIKDRDIFALLFLGAVFVTGIPAIYFFQTSGFAITQNQILVLIYLGIIASGLGFFLWNIGARKTNTGALAVFNNLKIPMAIAVSLLIFNESANIPNLIIGGFVILLALGLNEFSSKNFLNKFIK